MPTDPDNFRASRTLPTDKLDPQIRADSMKLISPCPLDSFLTAIAVELSLITQLLVEGFSLMNLNYTTESKNVRRK